MLVVNTDYRTSTGRFTGEDSYWRSHRNVARRDVLELMQCTNLYVYGVNNPLSYQDPSGNSAIALQVSPVEGLTYLEYVKICVAISQLDSALVGYADLGAGILLIGGTVYYGGKAVGELYEFLSQPRERTIVIDDGRLAAPSNATKLEAVQERESENSGIAYAVSTGSRATKTLADTRTKVPTTNDKVYQFAYVNQDTGSLITIGNKMDYAAAVAAVGATGIANSVASTLKADHPGYWGVYTNNQGHAKALAVAYGATASPEVHGDGFYGHYHDAAHKFHVWYGGKITY